MKTHIMLVDDDKDELTFFQDALNEIQSDEGLKCTYARNADHALEIVKYLVPDFIFVDYKMPGKSGLQFLAAIKNNVNLEQAKVYLYSIFIDEALKKAAMKLGAAGTFSKLFSIRALSTELGAVLNKSPVLPVSVINGGD